MTDGTPEGTLDGNAAAGALSQVFTAELSAAVATCEGCGRQGALAETDFYVSAPGVVLRCRGCTAVLVRLVVGPDRQWLDLRGVAVLQLPVTAG